MAFLRNHADVIAAKDFLTVPTASFQVLYVWFAILSMSDVMYAAVTRHPHASWVIQQLQEAFPLDEAPGYLIYDNDAVVR